MLAAELGHEVKNVVMVIRAITPTLLEELPPGGDGVNLVDDLVDTADRAARLSHRLMQLARDTLSDGPADLVEAVSRQVSTLRHIAKEGVAVELQTTSPAFMTRLSATDAQQIVFNLAHNAFDAMADGGTLEISVGVVNGSAVLVFHDDGAGMDETTLARCSEPFFTTKGELGSGLGLHAVRESIENAGGRMSIESRAGEGTTVSIYLPILAPAS